MPEAPKIDAPPRADGHARSVVATSKVQAKCYKFKPLQQTIFINSLLTLIFTSLHVSRRADIPYLLECKLHESVRSRRKWPESIGGLMQCAGSKNGVITWV
jgi:hypothetical protein